MNFSYVLMIVLAGWLLLVMWLGGLADRRREMAAGASKMAEPAAEPPARDGAAEVDAVGAVAAYADGPAPALYGADPQAVVRVYDEPAQPGVPASVPPSMAASGAAKDDTGTVLAGLAYTLLILLYLGLAFTGLMLQAIGALGPMLSQNVAVAGADPSMLGVLGSLGPTLWVPSLLGMILLLRPVRGLCARVIGIDRRRTVHALALSYTMFIMINLFSTVVLLPEMSKVLAGSGTNQADLVTPGMVWIQELYLALLAVIGVGWLSRRSFNQVLARLAIVVPTRRQVALGVGVGLAMIPVVALIEWLATTFNLPMDTNVQRMSEMLLGPLTQSALGIITLGVAAALGEEAIFRGALQPRFGLVLTAILFALMHGNYGFSLSTLVVLILGFVLGIVRWRTNTSTTMILHAVYNSTLGLLAFMNIMK